MPSALRSTIRIVHSTSERYLQSQRRVDAEVIYDYFVGGSRAGQRRVDSQTRRILLEDYYALCERLSLGSSSTAAKVDIRELSIRLAQVLVPPEALHALEKLVPGQTVDLDVTDHDMPWELVRVNDTFLSNLFLASRLIPDSTADEPSTRKTIVACLVGNPTGDLPAALLEVQEIGSTLCKLSEDMARSEDGVNLVIKQVTNDDATKRNVLFDCLLSEAESPTVFHFAGHVEFDQADPMRTCLKLQDSDLKAFEITRLPGRPIVFINACRSAISAAHVLPSIGMILGLAGQFIASGARAYIGTLWPVDDTLAADFAGAFYERLVAGGTLGEAFKDAQNVTQQRNSSGSEANSFVLFGNPDCRLWQPPQRLVTGPYLNADGILAVISVERDFSASECLVVEDLPWVLWTDDDISAWTRRLPISDSEQARCGHLIAEYREEFWALTVSGKRTLQCVLLLEEFAEYLNLLDVSQRNALALRIKELSAGGHFHLVLLDAPGLEELELVAKVENLEDARHGDVIYVFNKQTRLEGNSLRYYLYQEDDWNIVRRYMARFTRTLALGAEFTASRCAHLNIPWIPGSSADAVSTLIERWDEWHHDDG